MEEKLRTIHDAWLDEARQHRQARIEEYAALKTMTNPVQREYARGNARLSQGKERVAYAFVNDIRKLLGLPDLEEASSHDYMSAYSDLYGS